VANSWDSAAEQRRPRRRQHYGRAIPSGCLREGKMLMADELVDNFRIASFGSMVMEAVMCGRLYMGAS
jgi:hypothetical protein